jgi:hypothetical protein
MEVDADLVEEGRVQRDVLTSQLKLLTTLRMRSGCRRVQRSVLYCC